MVWLFVVFDVGLVVCIAVVALVNSVVVSFHFNEFGLV